MSQTESGNRGHAVGVQEIFSSSESSPISKQTEYFHRWPADHRLTSYCCPREKRLLVGEL